jgi:hypothetical protein
MIATETPVSTEDSCQAIFTGYYGVITDNRAVPVALFLSEKDAVIWQQEHDKEAKVRKYLNASLLWQALHQCCSSQ